MQQEKAKTKIWVLEDDPGCQFVYGEILEPRYDFKIFKSIAELKAACEPSADACADVLIADLRLPDGNFLQFLRENMDQISGHFRSKVVVSSLDDLDVLRECYQRGVVEYLTKPFGRSELLVRIENLLQDMAHVKPAPFNLNLDVFRLQVRRPGFEPVTLTVKEARILEVLLHVGEQPTFREQLEERVWGSTKVGSKTVDVHVSNLRKKLRALSIEVDFNSASGFQLLSLSH